VVVVPLTTWASLAGEQAALPSSYKGLLPTRVYRPGGKTTEYAPFVPTVILR
jgi:hypothetical protein